MDDLTPMEPSFQELPPEQPEQTPNYYGTGRPVQARSHLPVIAGLLILLLTANLLTMTVLARLRRSAQGGKTTVSAGDKQSVLPTTADLSGNAPAQEDSALDVSDASGRLTLREIYQKLTPSLTVVTAQIGEETQTGTGLLLTSNGYLLTNAHTVRNAAQLTVTLSDGASCTASFVGLDEARDLAVLRIEAAGLTAAEFGDSDEIAAGDAVVAFSNPFGETLSGTMTKGIISAVNEKVALGDVQSTVFQTNVALLSENAGGVLVNGCGQVIAVGLREAAGFVSYESASGIGFALPAQEVVRVANDLIRYGSVSGRPSLGLEISALDEPVRIYWGLPEGVLVTAIDRMSSAYEMGMRTGDLLLSINGRDVQDVASYLEALDGCDAGDVMHIVLYRNGTRYHADVPLVTASD